MSLTTMAAIMGRLITGMFIDHVNRRLVSSGNFLIQALAVGAMITSSTRLSLYIACIGFGLTVGNMTSLSALIVQHEFPQEQFGTMISLIVAFNQLTLHCRTSAPASVSSSRFPTRENSFAPTFSSRACTY